MNENENENGKEQQQSWNSWDTISRTNYKYISFHSSHC
jgi:hypothetical protein